MENAPEPEMDAPKPNAGAFKPNALESYSVIVLECGGRFLLLKRAPHKRFAPNLWTGIGGRVEADEFGSLAASAWRELREETGIAPASVTGFTLRRVVLNARPGDPLSVLLYFSGHLQEPVLPDCPEGTLAWLTAAQVAELELAGTSRTALPKVIEDILRDPQGREPVQVGVAVFRPTGAFAGVVWASDG